MVHVGTGYWYRLLQVVWCKLIDKFLQQCISQWFHYSTNILGQLDGAMIGVCSHLSIVSGENRGF
jgi:hypothetical protein